MGNDVTTINFHSTLPHDGLGGRVDHDNCVIRGVTLITSGIQAEGHDLHVDDKTVEQLHALAVKMKQVPVTLEHAGGINDVNGFLSNFSIQGNKLKGDWTLLQNHEQTPVMMERAEKQPTTFGMSCAFKGAGNKENGKKCARAEKLLSVDCVKRPAAAPDGLFSAKENNQVDTLPKNMANNDQSQQQAEPTLSDIMGALQQIAARQDAAEQVQGQLVDHVNQSIEGEQQEGQQMTPELLDALFNATPEQLAQFNDENGTDFTPENIGEMVNDFNASLGDEEGQTEGSEGSEEGAGSETATALSALAREVIQLKDQRKFELASARNEAETIEFAELQSNISTLVEQRDRLVELSERVIGENEALRMAGVRGGKPAGAGAEIEFKERSQGGSIIEFETVVNDKYCELVAAGMKDVTARSKAIDFGVKRHQPAYQLWRGRGNPEIQFSAK